MKALLVRNTSFGIMAKKSPKPVPNPSEKGSGEKRGKREIKVSKLKCN